MKRLELLSDAWLARLTRLMRTEYRVPAGASPLVFEIVDRPAGAVTFATLEVGAGGVLARPGNARNAGAVAQTRLETVRGYLDCFASEDAACTAIATNYLLGAIGNGDIQPRGDFRTVEAYLVKAASPGGIARVWSKLNQATDL